MACGYLSYARNGPLTRPARSQGDGTRGELAGGESVFWTWSSKAAGRRNATDKKPLGASNRMIVRSGCSSSQKHLQMVEPSPLTGVNAVARTRPATDQMAQRPAERRHLRLSSTVTGSLSAQPGPARRTDQCRLARSAAVSHRVIASRTGRHEDVAAGGRTGQRNDQLNSMPGR